MRKTKILVTLGPATETVEMIGKLIDCGANLIRLNMSHASHEWTRTVYAHVREAAKARNTDVGVLMDLTGPSIRTGDVSAPWQLKPGNFVEFRTDESFAPTTEFSTTVNYPGITGDLKVGDPISIDGGMIQMRATIVNGKRILAEVITGGEMKSRRHINLPGVDVNLPPLTKKDYADLDLGVELGVDYFALSFAREPAHIQHLELLLAQKSCNARVIAKIENQQALHNLDALVVASKGIMVARGDLGSECPVEDLPIIQRDIIERCSYYGRKVIVATQMLESMIENPLPTRAEITDVANAVFEQADAIMLSGETTVGKYPLKCIEVFDRISRRIERSGSANYHERADLTSSRQKLVKSAVVLADQLKADAMLVFTVRGNMARHAASFRPRYSPIVAICEFHGVADSLALNWGVHPFVHAFDHHHPERTIESAIKALVQAGRLRVGNTVVVVSAISAGEQIIEVVEMRTVA